MTKQAKESGEDQTTRRLQWHVRRRYRRARDGLQTGMTGNSNFTTTPVDLAVLKTNIDSLSALMAEVWMEVKR